VFTHVFGDIDQIFIIIKISEILYVSSTDIWVSLLHQGSCSFLQTWGLSLAFNTFKLSEDIILTFDGMDECSLLSAGTMDFKKIKNLEFLK
jgi:hypothetical protein